ncbi:FkbM family methyltransferase [Pseudaestuariivita atlantica]|uniref:Methyltransferase FkbM domain-containing protein n=1 Tax=Pseudaestuariivita atlantica TaxID=1317121 RepID=A0A0L1JS11_9RHOB|nr:FkbM family methyltransferase [Pseudaestuariivita atlantica]KNG94198.1 hypothetical protein ATO11_08220 [Pseudaestuariivita atlantica]
MTEEMLETTVDRYHLRAPKSLVKPYHLMALATGSYEWPERALAREHVAAGDTVLDFGAGLGIVASDIADSEAKAKVYSIEPAHASYLAARDTLALNRSDTIELRHGLVQSRAGAARNPDPVLYKDDENYLGHGQSIATGSGAESEHPPVMLLDDLIAETAPTVLNIDIEGGEADIFEGVDLSGVRTVIVEFHPDILGIDGCRAVADTLIAAGLALDFDAFYHTTGLFQRAPGSTLALPEDRAAFDRLLEYAMAPDNVRPRFRKAAYAAHPHNLYLRYRNFLRDWTDGEAPQAVVRTCRNSPFAALARSTATNIALERQNIAAARILCDTVSPRQRTGFDHFLNARVLLAEGQQEQALGVVRRACTGFPAFGPAHLLRGYLAAASGDMAQAKQAVDSASRAYVPAPEEDIRTARAEIGLD